MAVITAYDVDLILKAFGGDRDLFSKYFQIFKKNYPVRLADLESLIQQGGAFDNMYRVAHTLKGTLANFYIKDLTKMAEQFEVVIESHNLDDIKSSYAEFKSSMDALIDSIEKFLGN